jgi:hypothetical protein
MKMAARALTALQSRHCSGNSSGVACDLPDSIVWVATVRRNARASSTFPGSFVMKKAEPIGSAAGRAINAEIDRNQMMDTPRGCWQPGH